MSGCVVALGLSGVWVAQASAAGGKDIASAPVVAVGQQEFGNTASDGASPPVCGVSLGQSWWRLPVAAGDTAIVDFEGGVDYANLWPVGTTDFNLDNARGEQFSPIGPNGKQEATFTAAVPGTMPLQFAVNPCVSNRSGPYDFTVRILHGVVLAVPALSQLPLSGQVSVSVNTPAGVPVSAPALVVSFQIQSPTDGSWVTLGSAPAAGGVAAISFAVAPSLAGQKLDIRAVSTGAGYTDAASGSQTVQVQSSAAPPAPPAPAPPAPATPQPGPAALPGCVVPRLGARTSLAAIELRIRASHCSVGRITSRRAGNIRPGIVIGLSPRPGQRLAAGTAVDVTVSSGPRRRRHR